MLELLDVEEKLWKDKVHAVDARLHSLRAQPCQKHRVPADETPHRLHPSPWFKMTAKKAA